MRTMQSEGFALVNAGVTTFEEVQRTVYAPLDEMVFDETVSPSKTKSSETTTNGTAPAWRDQPRPCG
jgi:hypothetical protein